MVPDLGFCPCEIYVYKKVLVAQNISQYKKKGQIDDILNDKILKIVLFESVDFSDNIQWQ